MIVRVLININLWRSEFSIGALKLRFLLPGFTYIYIYIYIYIEERERYGVCICMMHKGAQRLRVE